VSKDVADSKKTRKLTVPGGGTASKSTTERDSVLLGVGTWLKTLVHMLSLLRCATCLRRASLTLSLPGIFSRARSQLAPRQVQHIKRHKGRIPIPTGGSIKGTTLAFGDWGIRIKGNGARFSAKQLTTAEEVIKRKIKVIKGFKIYRRVFPDIPVCVKVSSFTKLYNA
jgi:hypothetical protein